MAVPRGWRGTHRSSPRARDPERPCLTRRAVFHTENRFSRVFPRSGLASRVQLFTPPTLAAASANPLHRHRPLHVGSPQNRDGVQLGQEAGSRKYPTLSGSGCQPPRILAFTS